jgi:hypothetical protein
MAADLFQRFKENIKIYKQYKKRKYLKHVYKYPGCNSVFSTNKKKQNLINLSTEDVKG